MSEPLAHYHFLRWYRRGLSTAVGEPVTGIRPGFDVELRINTDTVDDEPVSAKKVHLFGPGDVLGIDPRSVTRMDPLPNVGDAEPNYMPLVEFSEPDLPWRFSSPDGSGLFIPWITLIVLKEDEILEQGQVESAKLGWIRVNTANLPDLSEAWRWAHVQVTADENFDRSLLESLIATEPERVVSRLLCARRLGPGTLYHAFIVPTFELGRSAGLGIDPPPETNALTLAWVSPASGNDGTEICLPFPQATSWEFRTGLRGDFEYLVRLLEPRKLTGLGIREMDCSNPGFLLPAVERSDENAPYPHTLGLEGALKSCDTQFSPWGKDAQEETIFQERLADEVLNRPRSDLDTPPGTRSVVAPPIYGRWHAGRDQVSPQGEAWIDVLNLDPRHRTAAGYGLRVVQEQQEQLMASAWDQVGALEEANELLRRAQLGRAGSTNLFKRLSALPLGDFLRIAAPVNSRVLAEIEGQRSTVQEHVRSSPIPLSALDPAYRRRLTGAVGKRQQPDTDPNRPDILERLNSGEVAAAGPPPNPDGMPGLCDITINLIHEPDVWEKVEDWLGEEASTLPADELVKRLGLFCEANIDCSKLPNELQQYEIVKALCQIFESWQIGLESPPPDPIDLEWVCLTLLEALDPQETIARRTNHRLRFMDMPEPADPLAERKVASELFPQPLYRPLMEISQDLILPGIENVPQNTIGVLKTNRRFVESFMVGWNHGFAAEALWRELPVPLNTTFARQFWDVSGYVPTSDFLEELRKGVEAETGGNEMAPDELDAKVEARLQELLKDIEPLRQWENRALGENDNRVANDLGEGLVLIVRGDLLKKYPNSLIYAVEARKDPSEKLARVPDLSEFLEGSNGAAKPPKFPLFTCKLPPDIICLGFDLGREEARGDIPKPPETAAESGFDSSTEEADEVSQSLGWYIVIEQMLSEDRFGADFSSDPNPSPPASWDDLAWEHFSGLAEGEYLNGRAPIPAASDEGMIWANSNDTTSATIACILLQKPVRIAVHMSRMIPEDTESQEVVI